MLNLENNYFKKFIKYIDYKELMIYIYIRWKKIQYKIKNVNI